jgi:hypothetical protein
MKSRTKRYREGAHSRISREAAEKAEAQVEAKKKAFRAADRVRKKAAAAEKRRRKEEQEQAARRASVDEGEGVSLSKREKAIARELAEDLVSRAGNLSHARQGAILWSLIGQPVLKSAREAAGMSGRTSSAMPRLDSRT